MNCFRMNSPEQSSYMPHPYRSSKRQCRNCNMNTQAQFSLNRHSHHAINYAFAHKKRNQKP